MSSEPDTPDTPPLKYTDAFTVSVSRTHSFEIGGKYQSTKIEMFDGLAEGETPIEATLRVGRLNLDAVMHETDRFRAELNRHTKRS